MNFPFFRFFLELRNEFNGHRFTHPTKTCPTFSLLALHHFFVFLSSPAFVATFENGQYTFRSVDENNTGDGQTLSSVPQESPSEISGPTIDVSMHSGKKKAHKKIKKNCVVYRNH